MPRATSQPQGPPLRSQRRASSGVSSGVPGHHGYTVPGETRGNVLEQRQGQGQGQGHLQAQEFVQGQGEGAGRWSAQGQSWQARSC